MRRRRDALELRNRALAATARGRKSTALQNYLTLEKLEPDVGDWPRRAADVYRRLGRLQDSVEAKHRAVTKYARSDFDTLAIALCHSILQTHPEDERALDQLRALGQVPHHVPVEVDTLTGEIDLDFGDLLDADQIDPSSDRYLAVAT